MFEAYMLDLFTTHMLEGQYMLGLDHHADSQKSQCIKQ